MLRIMIALAGLAVASAVTCKPGEYYHTLGHDCDPSCTGLACCCHCEPDFYCPGGRSGDSEFPCPAGTHSPANSSSESQCTGSGPGPSPGGACAPEQFFINYADAPDQMRISWATSCAAGAVVNYGTSSSLGSSTTGPAPKTYTFSGGYTSPYLYHVTLKGLTPGVKYFYTVGDATSGVSAVKSFVAHPGVGASVTNQDGSPFTMAIIGDLGQTSNSASTVAHVLAGSSNMVMHVGDLSYADSEEPRWDSWGALVAPLAETLPYMTQVGNHEQESRSFVAYAARFAMPAPASGVDTVWYSIDVASVHWITLSNYHDFTSGSAQYAWLKADLASIDRSKTPWVFMQTHAPWYNTNSAHQGDGEAQRKAMESLIYGAGVDAVFSGHVHAYERSHRAYNNARDVKGPVYITIGDGGNREGLATKWLSQTPISAFRQATYGHGEIVIVNSTVALWQWHENPDAESQVSDPITIVKGHDVLEGWHM